MKVTIESTGEIVVVNGVPCRVWEGVTERGIQVQALIPRIAAKANQDLAQFEKELKECRPPLAVPRAFPARLIL